MVVVVLEPPENVDFGHRFAAFWENCLVAAVELLFVTHQPDRREAAMAEAVVDGEAVDMQPPMSGRQKPSGLRGT